MQTRRDRHRKPTHPGAILREDVLPSLRMSQGEFAQRLGVSRVTVNTLLQERRDLSVELAKDSEDTPSGKRQVAQLQDITQYRVAVFLAREDSLALLRDAYKKWPLLKQVAGPNVFLDVIIDRRES